MHATNRALGILTLATPGDYLKAIGLALSLKVSNPDLPRAVACHPRLRAALEPYFDHIVEEVPGLRGFAHKVYLDRYSPFERTLFLDSDILVFRDVRPFVDSWGEQPYIACGKFLSGGFSSFGLDRAAVLQRLGKARMVCIDGAGHALFHTPACVPVFDRAREITEHYPEHAGSARYADEDVMDMVMTEFGYLPAPYGEFFSRYISARPGTLEMDATRGVCRFVAVTTGEPFAPCMMHFAANEAPLPYTWQLFRLFRHFGVREKGLLKLGVADYFDREIRPQLRRVRNQLRGRRATGANG